MKASVSVIFIFLILFFQSGCQDNPQSTNSPDQNNAGRILFSIDKVNAPNDVRTLTTILSRSGYPSKQKVFDIIRDTGATILFEEVETGTWMIQVDAKNDSGKIIYTGKSEVTVFENFVSQVNLVLTKVLSGTGSVLINISWQNNYQVWKDYAQNPVLSKTGGYIDWGGVGQPKILYENGLFRMYYLNYSFPSPVSYAESKDGINWYRLDTLPVIIVGKQGSWDDGGVGPGPVYKINGEYFMLYQGYDSPTKHFRIGLAKSFDGKVWMKYPSPVLSDSLPWEGNMVASDVEFINNKYYLYYCTNGKIGLAVSNDGIGWTRISSQPILSPTQTWELNNITFPSVVKKGNKYLMIYMSNGAYSSISFGIAESDDGLNWIKQNPSQFFNKNQTTGNWAFNGIVYPYAIEYEDQTRIYYTGVCDKNEWKIGFLYR